MSTLSKPVARYRVGDWVLLKRRLNPVKAKIIELRGPLGGKDRVHIYRVELPIDGSEPDRFEVDEDGLEPTTPPN